MKIVLKYAIIAIVIIVCIVAIFLPRQMISPGHLVAGHTKLDNDCFSCHSFFRGVTNEKCIKCHKIKDIGILNTKGEPLDNNKTKMVAFHQALTQSECIACHIDHDEDKTKRINRQFSHDLLASNIKNNCLSCHQKPKDTLHNQLNSSCLQCHTVQKWKPATFEHGKYFSLDKDHNVKCSICHTQNNFKQYTCYGCHEHTEIKIRNEHLEEGIREFNNCTECHKSSNKKDAENLWRSKNGKHGD